MHAHEVFVLPLQLPMTRSPRHFIRSAIALAILSIGIRPGLAQNETPVTPDISLAATDQPESGPTATNTDVSLQFAFDRTPWRDVITWLADSSGLALHVTDLPSGSFSYSDSSEFTPQQALDRVNLFLLPQGFTLVRSGRLLSVIDLSDPRSVQQLNSLARHVTVEQLDELEGHEVTRCFFPLTQLQPEEAIEELSALNLMTAPSVFRRTNQILVTDTAGKLRTVKAILDAFKPHALANGTVVKTFMLQHVDAEEILTVARPHLGLATGEMIGIDVSVSADPQGKSIFVTGIQDKVKMLEGLITEIDQPEKSLRPESGTAELRSHPVLGGDVETVYNVLQTLLATEKRPIRLSVDETAGSIVALATADIQNEIAETVAKLAGSEAEFEVIPLRTVDPYFAITLLEEMLDLSQPETTDYRRSRYDDDEPVADVPKIDADPANMRLFVRGKRHQIEQIKSIIAGLDIAESAPDTSGVRLFPLRGPQAESTLEAAARFWRAPNPIVLLPAIELQPARTTERVVAEPSSKARSVFGAEKVPQPRERLLTKNPFSTEPEIVCQFSPRGLLLQSDDGKALDRFEEHLRLIAGRGSTTPSPPIVFYLKYTRAEEALRMLSELFDGGASVRETESGSLVNTYVSGNEAFFGSLLTSRDGMTTMTVGSITIVADSRLNRLIAQGTSEDLEQIEDYLKIIDKDQGITDIETYGTSQVIELTYARASEVADAIRSAYAGRVTGGQSATVSSSKSASGAPPPQDSRDDSRSSDKSNNDKKSSKKESTGSGSANLEPRMTIAVHETSNSLIVTAPEPLFREVERLAQLIDQRSRKKVQIVTLPNTSAVDSLREIFSGSAGRNSSNGGSFSRVPAPSSSKSPAAKAKK